jgi:hypothetical protein
MRAAPHFSPRAEASSCCGRLCCMQRLSPCLLSIVYRWLRPCEGEGWMKCNCSAQWLCLLGMPFSLTHAYWPPGNAGG